MPHFWRFGKLQKPTVSIVQVIIHQTKRVMYCQAWAVIPCSPIPYSQIALRKQFSDYEKIIDAVKNVTI